MVIIYEVFFLYAATAGLAILGQVPVMVLICKQDWQPKAFTFVTILNNVIIFIVQTFIIIIFNKLISVANESKQRAMQLAMSTEQSEQLADSQSMNKSDELDENEQDLDYDSHTMRTNSMKKSNSSLNDSIGIQVLMRQNK